MKEKLLHAAGCLLFFVLVSTTSCKKIIDEIVKHPSKGVVEDCRIEKIIGSTSLTYSNASGDLVPYFDTAYFTYNNFGAPTSVKHSLYRAYPEESKEHFLTDRIYKYDSQKRLKVYLNGYKRVYGSGVDSATSWSVFSYSANQVTEVQYQLASAPYSPGDEYITIPETPTQYDHVSTAIHTLDQWGRIIKTTWDFVTEEIFNYDASGNLTGEDFTYSNNYSYLQTNKIWMFLAHDYSVNVKTAPLLWYDDDYPVEFNSRKLPTRFDFAYPIIFDSRAEPISRDAVMIYKCK